MGLHGTYGTKIGPRDIIKNNLRVHCTMQPISYNGTDAIWRDLTGFQPLGAGSVASFSLSNTAYDYGVKASLLFNGTSSYGRQSITPVYPFTISVMAYANDVGEYYVCLFCSSLSNTPWHGLIFRSSGKIAAGSESTTSGGQKVAESVLTYKKNTWYNIVGVWTSTNRSLYVNGEFQSTESTSVTINTGASAVNRFSIGVFDRPSPAAYLNGKISNVLYYNRQLTQTEIIHNYMALRKRYNSFSS